MDLIIEEILLRGARMGLSFFFGGPRRITAYFVLSKNGGMGWGTASEKKGPVPDSPEVGIVKFSKGKKVYRGIVRRRTVSIGNRRCISLA